MKVVSCVVSLDVGRSSYKFCCCNIAILLEAFSNHCSVIFFNIYKDEFLLDKSTIFDVGETMKFEKDGRSFKMIIKLTSFYYLFQISCMNLLLPSQLDTQFQNIPHICPPGPAKRLCFQCPFSSMYFELARMENSNGKI